MLTNKYLEYSKSNITKEVFVNIWKILKKDGYDSSFDIDTMWEYFTGGYPYLTYNRDIKDKKWVALYLDSTIKTICTPITVEEIFRKGEEYILEPFKSFKGGIRVDSNKDLDLIKEFLLFLCPENPYKIFFTGSVESVYFLCLNSIGELSIEYDNFYHRKDKGPIVGIHEAIISYRKNGYNIPQSILDKVYYGEVPILKEDTAKNVVVKENVPSPRIKEEFFPEVKEIL